MERPVMIELEVEAGHIHVAEPGQVKKTASM